jgi:hypothetical protein
VDYLGITINLENNSISQYADFNFNSMTKFGDKYIGASENGIFELVGETDNEYEIYAFIESPISDFLSSNQKRIRFLLIGCEVYGQLLVTVQHEGQFNREYTVTPVSVAERDIRVPVGTNGKGRYWMFRIENVDGSDFSIDSLEAMFTLLERRPLSYHRVSWGGLDIPLPTVAGTD